MEYNYKDIVNKVQVYGLHDSIVASGYPMITEVNPNFLCAGEKDVARAKRLANTPAGSGHSTFLQGIIVQFDLTFPVKAWTELQRYHFIDFVSSQSTMHRITKFDLDNAYDVHVDKRVIEIMKELVKEYNELPDDTPAEVKAEKYLDILMTNPNGFNLTARMTTNYAQLKTIYRQRKDHRLPCWRAFCKWIETLPYSDFITGEK